jgi:hypothetical protein
MKIYLIAQMRKVFAFFLLFALLDASLNDGIVSQSILNNGSEPIEGILSSDKSYYLEKEIAASNMETTVDANVVTNESLVLNSQSKSRASSGNERHRYVLPVVKLTTAHPEF